MKVPKMAIGMPGPWELGIIAIIVGMIFGVGKLGQLGGILGESIKGFRESIGPVIKEAKMTEDVLKKASTEKDK